VNLKNEHKRFHFTRLTCLGCLLAITAVPIGGTYAKYVSNTQLSSGDARVAAWVVEVEDITKTPEINKYESTSTETIKNKDGTETTVTTSTISYKFSVSNVKNDNVSEVDAKYEIVVNFDEDVDKILNLYMYQDGTGTATGAKIDMEHQKDDNDYKFTSNNFVFNAGEKSAKTYILKITVNGSPDLNSNVTINVIATQTD
jgi:hypothetical protein